MLTFVCLFTSLPESSFASFGREHVASSKLFHSAPQDFYESSKTCCRIPEEQGHSSHYLPERLSSFGCHNGGSCEKYSAGSDSPSVARFYNKPQEIFTDSNTSDNLPGFPNRLSVHDDITPGRKKRQNSRLLSPTARFSKYQIAKPSKFNRPVRVLETSHLASSTTLSSLAVRSDKRPINEPGVLRRFDCTVTECQSRTCLVVETHPQCKRQSRAYGYVRLTFETGFSVKPKKGTPLALDN